MTFLINLVTAVFAQPSFDNIFLFLATWIAVGAASLIGMAYLSGINGGKFFNTGWGQDDELAVQVCTILFWPICWCGGAVWLVSRGLAGMIGTIGWKARQLGEHHAKKL